MFTGIAADFDQLFYINLTNGSVDNERPDGGSFISFTLFAGHIGYTGDSDIDPDDADMYPSVLLQGYDGVLLSSQKPGYGGNPEYNGLTAYDYGDSMATPQAQYAACGSKPSLNIPGSVDTSWENSPQSRIISVSHLTIQIVSI